MTLNSPLSIEGDGATVEGNGIDRVFDVLTGARAEVDELIVTGGSTLGGESGGGSSAPVRSCSSTHA